MCMSCGCKQPNEDHGDQRNITIDGLQQAADASGISVDEVVRNIQETFRERSPVGVGAGSARSGYTGQQPGNTGGQTGTEEEKPFSEEERTQREF
jgi:hypothetical protein